MISSTYTEAYLQKFLHKFQHLKIQLEEIVSATNNFDDQNNCIGRGGYGKVYKGEMSHSKGRSVVAIKRLDRTSRQGVPEFLKEITMLSDYKHENLISLLGYCCAGGEMILVYELASRGSLDCYLKSPHLTWRRRLKICLDAAKGLSYLHDPRETHRRLIHCDVKSGNILLDDQWNAKVSDFGLSTMGSANEQHSVIVIPAAGTEGYIDPLYWMTHTLTKESDVYSFGVVLFEVLCGRLCYTLDKGHVKEILVPMWIKSYEQKKLNDIIFRNSNIESMHQSVLNKFSSIAYDCLKEFREDRPEMADVVTKLVVFTSYSEMKSLQWFSLDKNGKKCHMLSAALIWDWKTDNKVLLPESRFGEVVQCNDTQIVISTGLQSQVISSETTYACYLVYKLPEHQSRFKAPVEVHDHQCNLSHSIWYIYLTSPQTPVGLKVGQKTHNPLNRSKFKGLPQQRYHGWMEVQIWELGTGTTTYMNLMLEVCHLKKFSGLIIEGIEFRPI